MYRFGSCQRRRVNLRSWAPPKPSMAIRQIQKRLLSLFASTNIHTSLPNEPLWQFRPSANHFFSRYEFSKRRIQTETEPSEQAVKDVESHEASLSNPTDNDDSAVKFNAASNLKISPNHDLAMIFTCKVCETRSVKTMCRQSYEKGVVVARCGGCNKLHLIADHLGWFGQPGSVEDLLAARGEEVKKGSADTLNLTLEDLAGKEKMDGL
ncbi:hypothetical protein ACSBR2_007370 [Camellia fascicularis]